MMKQSFSSTRFLIYFLLLLSRPPGSWEFVISVPTNYTALQGQLVVHISFPKEEENEVEERFPNAAQNSSIELETNSSTRVNEIDRENGENVFNGEKQENKFVKREQKEATLQDLSQSSSSSSSFQPFFLSLYATHSEKPLKRYKVPDDWSQTGFVFPCGVVVHGGQHIVRLKKNRNVIAESPKFNVSWPKLVIDVPTRLETYRSPADIQFRFIQSICLPNNPTFRTWAELLYHGPEVSRSSPIHPSNPPILRHVGFSNLEVTMRRKREKEDGVEIFESEAKNKYPVYSMNRANNYNYNVNLVKVEELNNINDNKPSVNNVKSDLIRELKKDFDQRSKISFDERYFNTRNISTSRPKRMFTLTSLQGSTIPSRSNTNIKPEALKKWSWESISPGVQIAQRVPVEYSLYSPPEHEIRFSCEVVGPAGIYSVRVVTDVPTSPIIARSITFLVAWAEEFTMYIPTPNLIPCLASVPVSYTHPMCVGSQDKIRLYAHVRANVSSANPPMYLRYITEKRTTNKTTSFDCSFFTDEPSDYCFVYVNRAASGAVSNVRRQCVPTFKPYVLRMDGGWSQWSDWTKCTSSCGTGIRIKHRFCNNPSPRNGGLYCQGPSINSSSCGDPTCVPPLQLPIPSSVIPPSGDNQECQCGCHVALEKDFDLIISASAEECSEMATWIFEGPPGCIIAAELSRAALLPGSQWLKIRDGNSTSSPLLLALPSSNAISSHQLERVPARLTSTTPVLFVSFRSDVNSSVIGSVWGFRMTIRAMTPTIPEIVLAVLGSSTRKEIAAIQIVIMVFGAITLVAIAAYGAYYCRQYPHYEEALLVVDDSPLESLDGSPFHQRRPLIASTGSVTTLTEVLSLKTLKFGVRRVPSYSFYTRLARSCDFKKGTRSALPSSPLISSKSFSDMRSSSSQLTRILRRGSIYKKQRNRRSASFGQLSATCIPPIIEDKPLPNSFTMEDIGNENEKKVYVEIEKKPKDESERGEDNSVKYKEHRKSLLITKNLLEKLKQDGLEPSKLSKERLNRERASLERLRRDNGNIVRASSSVSEISVTGTEMELELDYYDYDVGNASAVPGSLFGMDPTLMPWLIDIDDLDIKSADQLTSPDRIKLTDEDLQRLSLASPPPLNIKNRPEEIQLQQLNIVPVTDLLQQSSTSNESNENNDIDDDKTPTAESSSLSNGVINNDKGEEREAAKILNIHDVEDFQFADDSEDED